jgi:Fe-S cluster assembly protein SufD
MANLSKKEQMIAGMMKSPITDFNPAQQNIREEALQALTRLELPSLRDEAWKYTRIAAVLSSDFEPKESSLQSLPEGIQIPELKCHTLVFDNGHFCPHLSEIHADDSVQILTLAQARIEAFETLDQHYAALANHSEEVFTALNTAFHHTGAFVRVHKNVQANYPVHIIHHISENGAVAQFRNLFVADIGAQVNIIESFVGNNTVDTFENGVSEIIVAENAQLQHWQLQHADAQRISVHQVHVFQENNSTFTGGAFTTGGKLVRNNINIAVEGTNCQSNLYGAYVLSGRQHADNHTIIDHIQPHCESNENFKGILSGKATGVFNGKVFVRKEAQKTNAFQSNKNILLSDDATINSKPELEIYADDVKCSHGSTTGQLDRDALFYLQSRGVHPDTAKVLMIHAFALEVTEKIENQALRLFVEELISEHCKSL